MINLYIDPGTGSMLFTIIIGAAGVVIFGLRALFNKLKFFVTGGRRIKTDDKKVPYLIYTDSKRYWNVFEPICDEFEKRGIPVTYWTSSSDDPVFDKEYKHIKAEFIGEGNKAFMRLNLCKADVVIATTPGLDVYQWKRSKDVGKYAHIPHSVNDITRYRMFGLDGYDVVFVPADYQVDQLNKLSQLRGLPNKEVVVAGQVYLDAMAARLAKVGRVKSDVRTVLLAPSWGDSSILNRFGSKFIDELVATGYRIIIRPHPQSFTSDPEMLKELMEKYPNSDMLQWNTDNDNFDVLNKSDIMISDFSGVQFDFTLVFEKPIIFTDTDYDSSPYDSAWLDEELWTFTALPRLGKKLTIDNMGNIKNMIDELVNDTDYKKKCSAVRDETWQKRGHAAENMVDYLVSMTASSNEGQSESKKQA